jgi:hypothetical protein
MRGTRTVPCRNITVSRNQTHNYKKSSGKYCTGCLSYGVFLKRQLCLIKSLHSPGQFRNKCSNERYSYVLQLAAWPSLCFLLHVATQVCRSLSAWSALQINTKQYLYVNEANCNGMMGFFFGFGEHSCCHGMPRRLQAFHTIKLPCLGTK